MVAGLHGLECAAVDLPGLASQQERVRLRESLKEMLADVTVPVRDGSIRRA